MKSLLLAAYVVSVMYCYLNINAMIDKCVALFEKRHPTIPMEKWSSKNIMVNLEILGVSAIPFLNLSLGYFVSTFEDDTVLEIVSNVEMNHRAEIDDAERLLDKLEDLDKYF